MRKSLTRNVWQCNPMDTSLEASLDLISDVPCADEDRLHFCELESLFSDLQGDPNVLFAKAFLKTESYSTVRPF